MTRLIILAGVLGVCSGLAATSAWAAPTPIFYTSLNDAASITSTGGTLQGNLGQIQFVPGVVGNAFSSTVDNNNNFARWTDAAVTSIFTDNGWNNSNGITIDHYFQGKWTGVPAGENEGMWSMVRRWTNGTDPAGVRESYLFTSIQSGKLRIAFANKDTEQYKFTFNGASANPGSQEYANENYNSLLLDDTPYRLTVSIGNGQFKVWLDDLGGLDIYDNSEPFYTFALPEGYYWQLPPSGDVNNSGNGGQLTRRMIIGNRGEGNNFGGTLLPDTWVDEVKIYNGIYTPADLDAVSEPLPGDHNGDNVVDALDYVVWRADPASNQGDDGYLNWRENYGEVQEGSGTGHANGTAVPEPSLAALVVLACCSLAIRRCGRR